MNSDSGFVERVSSGSAHGAIGLKKIAGMSLIEVVIAIVIISTALTAILSAISSLMQQSTDPAVQEQGILLAQSYLEDLLARDYDAVCSNLLNVSPCTGTCATSTPCVVTFDANTLPGTPEQYNPVLLQMVNLRYTMQISILDSGFDIIPNSAGRQISATVQHLRLGGLTLTQSVQDIARLTAFQARHYPAG